MTALRLADIPTEHRSRLRALVYECLGLSPWDEGVRLPNPWLDETDATAIHPALPLHLPTGRDIGARFMALLLGVEGGATAPEWRRGQSCWVFAVNGDVYVFARDPDDVLVDGRICCEIDNITDPGAAMLVAIRALINREQRTKEE